MYVLTIVLIKISCVMILVEGVCRVYMNVLTIPYGMVDIRYF